MRSFHAVALASWLGGFVADGEEIFIRVNQAGYHRNETKVALASSKAPLPEAFTLVGQTNEAFVFFRGKAKPVAGARWGQFENHAELDFSSVQSPGQYVLNVGGSRSLPVRIGDSPYPALIGPMLEFMREQRCGYNPWLDAVCHPYDGRTAFGPVANGTYLDARGGWHGAADLLKYLLTSGNATAPMLLAYQLASPRSKVQGPKSVVSGKWAVEEDRVNGLGQEGANGVPDILDEARWGLDWMLKLHPAPDQLYHQVADDRDHVGRK